MITAERLSQLSVIAIGTVAVIAALDFGAEILAPVTLALVAGVVFSPFAEFWERRGYQSFWGAFTGLAATLIVLGGLILALHPIVSKLLVQAPKVWADIQDLVAGLRGLIRGISDVAESVTDAVVPAAQAAAGSATAQETAVPLPSVTDALMIAPTILSQILIFSGVLFFFLLTRSEIYDWIALRLSDRGGRGELASRLRQADRHVARYFSTITLINAALGAITAAVIQVLGVTDAVIWGLVAFFANFVVYLGPAAFVVILLYIGVAEFDGAMSLAPALSFLMLNTIEGQFVTPALVGRNMSVNPLLVFLAIIFGLWLWGPVGGIVAIPLLLWILVLNRVIVEQKSDVATPVANPV